MSARGGGVDRNRVLWSHIFTPKRLVHIGETCNSDSHLLYMTEGNCVIALSPRKDDTKQRPGSAVALRGSKFVKSDETNVWAWETQAFE